MGAAPFRLAVIAGALIWAALLAANPAGLFTVDELVQLAAVIARAGDGGFVFDNGFGTYESRDLLLLYLVEGPAGPVSQYPAGYTLVAAPVFRLAGMQGLFALNLAAALVSLWLTHRIVAALSGDAVARLAVLLLLFASFLVDYAIGLWPHALALAFTLAAAWGAVLCGLSEARLRPGAALLGGLALGLGITVRVDVAFALPGLAVWMLLFGARPVAHIALAGLGALPGLILATWFNFQKFGVLSPLSYGADRDGGVDPRNYLFTLAIFAAALAATLIMRFAPRTRLPLAAAGALALAAALAVLPEARAPLLRLGEGTYVLLVDLSAIAGAGLRKGIEITPEGWVTFFNLFKKALGQSLPWLGLLPLALFCAKEHRRGMWLALLVSGSVIFPFALKIWHGGYASNMRYFLAALPFAAYLGALALDRLLAAAAPSRRAVALPLLLTAVALFATIALASQAGRQIIEHAAPPWILLGLALGAVAVLITRRAARVVLPAAVAALAWAGFSAYVLDIGTQKAVRGYARALHEGYAGVPPGSVVYDNFTPALTGLLGKDRIYAAVSGTVEGSVDADFVRRALADGLRVVIRDPRLQQAALSEVPGSALAPPDFPAPEGTMLLRVGG